MGCDIHAFIEYHHGNGNWWPFGSEFRLTRDYNMFSLLAGVRKANEYYNLFSAKGLPDNISHEASDHYWTKISENGDGESNSVSLTVAQRWVDTGQSKLQRDYSGEAMAVSSPDFHSHSWLTCEEFSEALDQYQIRNRKHKIGNEFTEAGYYAVEAAMKALLDRGCKVRLVFWFDN